MIRTSINEFPGGAVGRITLDRPEKKNALTPEMISGIVAGVREFGGELSEPCRPGSDLPGAAGQWRSGSSGVRAIVIDGSGAAFCSGFDLTLCRENSDALAVLLKGLSEAIVAMRRCPVPIVLAAHGAAIAGGCALLGGADIVVTHTEAKIGYPVVRLGISPAVSAPFLRQSVGDGPARERMLDSTLISGWEAFRMGLAHECLEDAGKVRDRAMTIAQQLAAKPAHGMQATKRWLGEIDGSFGADAERGLGASLALVGSEEERGRLAAIWKA